MEFNSNLKYFICILSKMFLALIKKIFWLVLFCYDQFQSLPLMWLGWGKVCEVKYLPLILVYTDQFNS